LEDVAKYDKRILVEKFIPSRELTVGVLGEQVLPILEIIPKGGFYDFTTKYPFLNPSAGASAQHICPAQELHRSRSGAQELARHLQLRARVPA
ncbi:MAG: D-alanine--D-alanine ligase, partial [Chthoniobacterales bacterium]